MCQYVLNHLTYLMIFRRLLLSFEITWFGSTWQYTEACIIQTNLLENKESTKLHAHVLCVLTCYPANVSCVLTSNVGTWARKVRENISTQGTLARKHAKHVGTRGRKTRWYTSTLLARRARHLAGSKTNEVSDDEEQFLRIFRFLHFEIKRNSVFPLISAAPQIDTAPLGIPLSIYLY